MIKVIASSFIKNSVLCAELLREVPNAEMYQGKEDDTLSILHFCKDAKVLLVGREKIDARFLDACPNVELIAKYGVGLDNIDQNELQKRNIILEHTPGVNKISVAEMTLSFILGAAHNIFYTGNKLKKGEWYKNGGVCLQNKKVGVIGLGNVGSEVVRMLQVFGVEIWGNDIVDKTELVEKFGIHIKSKEDIFAQCDFITLHIPFDASTQNVINNVLLSSIHRHAFLINCARGELIHHNDIIYLLKNQCIAGYFADAFSPEPYYNMELIALDNFFGTPHIGGNSVEAVLNMGRAAITHIKNYTNNKI